MIQKKVFNDWNEVYKSKTTQEIDNVPNMEKGMRQSTPKTIKKLSSRWNGKDLASIVFGCVGEILKITTTM